MMSNEIVRKTNYIVYQFQTSKTSAAEYGYDDISKKSRQFAFDYCFPATDGSCPSANIANQEKVF